MRDATFKIAVIAFLLHGCSAHDPETESLFTTIDPGHSGVSFTNTLVFSDAFNIYTYRNYYNGAGVAIGDINNDGLPDLYFTGNQVPNKLYLNRGDFVFEDITDKAGVAGTQTWSTGVAMADVNGDGLLDIYVCNSGNVDGGRDKRNELFINQGDLTFKEMAHAYHVADEGYTTHAVFFDYDNDQDLDLYILNNSYQAIGSFNLRKNERGNRDAMGGDKLLRNDGDRFTDVSEAAGIYGSVIGFGLGVTVGDVNKDGWMDIFVSNDFFERDYLYLNNSDGTFREVLTDQIRSISASSMGADLADLNNDAWPDIFVTEMLPRDNARLKTVTTFEDWNRYQYNVQNDYHHQFTRNVLHVNRQGTGFQELGRMAGVEATDWSWGALLFDMDNDGRRDIFVANGIYQDITNQDFLTYASNEEFVKAVVQRDRVDYEKLTEIIPSTPIPNVAFRNIGEWQFENHAAEWGLAAPSYSNGAAYGDLDNDGDLDLVINNVNMPATLHRNNADSRLAQNRFLQIVLEGNGQNTFAIGTKVTAQKGDRTFYVEQVPNRGFQSTVDHRLHLGLGNIDWLDQLTVSWPDGSTTVLDSVPTNQMLTLRQHESTTIKTVSERPSVAAASAWLTKEVGTLDYQHAENLFVDFDRERLSYHMLSTEGPRLAKGDVNGDGLEDVYIGGPRGQAGALFLQDAAGRFRAADVPAFLADKQSEDQASLFFDADGDGDLDLYVCSGGSEFSPGSTALIDRLYFNDGDGGFVRSNQILPSATTFESTSTVTAGDYDRDGDLDLFVGVRLRPLAYGLPVHGYILENDGRGQFRDVTEQVAPALRDIGMITDALWCDVDQDEDVDLVVVGEYMPVTVFVNKDGRLAPASTTGLAQSHGWWNRIEAGDIDGDGDVDFVVGNHGLNSRFRASPDKPLTLCVGDFDRNGSLEQVICVFNEDTSYPLALRHDLVAEIPSLKKKYLKYESFKHATIEDIFTPEQRADALQLKAFELRSAVLLNDGEGRFALKPLPLEAQVAPVYGLELADIDGDGNTDLLLGGNLYNVKPQAGPYDASYGLLLTGDGKGGFRPLTAAQSGVDIAGEVRDIITVATPRGRRVLVSRNRDTLQVYRIFGSL